MSNGLTPMIAKHMSDEYDVLALGIGIGNVEIGLPCRRMIGLDIYEDYLLILSSNAHIKGKLGLVKGDVREVDAIFGENEFDAVIALDVIEHLEKKEGLKMLGDMERIATKKVILYTPLKWSTNQNSFKDKTLWSYGNKYQEHKSLWTIEDFEKRGYKVYLEYPNENNPEGMIAVKVIA